MFIKAQEHETKETLDQSSKKIVANDQEKQLVDALNLYINSIKENEAQPEWIYANSITLSAQLYRFNLGDQLIQKAEKLYPQNEAITRAIALLYEKQNLLQEGINYYQKAIKINPLQPEWIYLKVYKFLLQNNLLEQAEVIRIQGLKYFPQSQDLQENKIIDSAKKPELKENSNLAFLTPETVRFTPQNIEHNVELNVAELRRKLMDSSIIEKYEIILEQMLYSDDQARQKVDSKALLHCLAEIKTDIHYLKTKLLDAPAAAVDPQAKPRVNIEKIVSSIKPVPIRCELRYRVVGSGWHDAEQHGRWTGSGTLSSLVLPYPVPGEYRLEITVRAEAKPGLLKTLKVNVNNQPVSIATKTENIDFPTVVQAEVVITEQAQSFLTVDLTIDETIKAQASDTRLIGLLIEQVSLIPLLNQVISQ